MGDGETSEVLVRDNWIFCPPAFFQALYGAGLREVKVRDPSLTTDTPSPAGEVTGECGVLPKQSGLGS